MQPERGFIVRTAFRPGQALLSDLQRLVAGTALQSEEALTEVSEDYGRVLHKRPKVVVRPADSTDVARVVGYAKTHGLTVTSQGAAHSQGGQSLNHDGILLDLRSLRRIHTVSVEEQWVLTETGVFWHHLVEAVFAKALLPPVLTTNLFTTVGGTLSTGGYSTTSFRYGLQADTCLEIEVVTGDGDLLWCSPDQHPELFSHTLGGLGQLAVITRAKLRLRRFKPYIRTFLLVYKDLEAWLKDTRTLCNGRADYLGAFYNGSFKVQRLHESPSQWFYPLSLSVETDSLGPLDTFSVLEGLQHALHVKTVDTPIKAYALPNTHFSERRDNWNRSVSEPGMNFIVPGSDEEVFKHALLQLRKVPREILLKLEAYLLPGSAARIKKPLFVVPKPEDFFVLFGIVPTVLKQHLPQLMPVLREMRDLVYASGGNHYLAGWVDLDPALWRRHFGASWTRLNQLKNQYDPHHLLNRGVIPYEKVGVPGNRVKACSY